MHLPTKQNKTKQSVRLVDGKLSNTNEHQAKGMMRSLSASLSRFQADVKVPQLRAKKRLPVSDWIQVAIFKSWLAHYAIERRNLKSRLSHVVILNRI